MSRSLRRAAAVAVAALLVAVADVPSAQADKATFSDVPGHITTVRVDHGPQKFKVTADDAEIASASSYEFWLETDNLSSEIGPEWVVEVYPDSGASALREVTDFTSPRTTIACDGLRAIADVNGPDFVKIMVPRSCIGTPDRVALTVVGFYEENSQEVVDWAPGEERHFPYVPR